VTCALWKRYVPIISSPAMPNIMNFKVSSAMRYKMREPTIWSTALRDVWAVKPRPFQPSTTGLPVAKIKALLLHETHLEERLSSMFQPRVVQDIRVEGRLEQARFVPGTGGSYITVYHGGRTELCSFDGELLDCISDVDSAPPHSTVRITPVTPHSANIIQVHTVSECVVPSIIYGVRVY
jgi:hypothetical protein